MRGEQSYPAPIYGISTLAPRNRPKGYASEQVNFRSDPVNKLTRRPSSLYKGKLTTVSDATKILYHTYERSGNTYSYVLDKVNGNIYCMVNEVVMNTLNLGGYVGDNMGMYTIDHNTYVLNRDREVKLLAQTDANVIKKVSHINVKSAMNYGEEVVINLSINGGNRQTAKYTVPVLGSPPNYDAADKARATKQVAIKLAEAINALTGSTYTAVALGSAVAVWSGSRTNWVHLEVESGQGDRTTVAINRTVEKTDGLPLFAVVGTRITVRPDPTSEKGIYYLQAERVADDPSGEELEEVVWSEDRSPLEPYRFDPDTMPQNLRYDGSVFTLSKTDAKDRQAGDDTSCPAPDFVDNTIQTIDYFQKRLVFVSENNVIMTETDDLKNWWRQSAVNLLVSDTASVSSSELGTDKIIHLVPHNRDLLCIASNSQFKINGSEAVTPQSISMGLTTKYECQISTAPVTIGNSVFFPIDYGDSTGIQEYTGEKETSQDFAAPITNHIIGYLVGAAEYMAASPNLEMIAMTTTNSPQNVIYVYEQYTESSGKRTQKSWSQWELPKGDNVIALHFRRNTLQIVVARGNDLIFKSIEMYTRVTASALDVYLDDMLILDTTGSKVTVPTEYDTNDCIAVRGAGTDYELWQVNFTRNGDDLEFDRDIGEGKVYIGRTFRSSYSPTRPFRYDEDGSTITTDKIRISRYILSLVETHEVSMRKESKFANPVELDFESRFVGQYKIGTIEAYTGDWKFSFAEEASLATAEFFCNNHLGCTISDISWEGQYFQTKQRIA